MKFVNNAGTVTSVYNRPQPGIAERELADDHPEIIAFNARRNREPTSDERADEIMDSAVMAAVIEASSPSPVVKARMRQAVKDKIETEINS